MITFLKIIDTMPLSSEEILSQFGGKASNDLNNMLDIDEIPDPDGEIADLSKTEYIDCRTFKIPLRAQEWI